MPKYYGVARSSEYLAHYGVKGMKWGVRKAIERGSERALDRQWRKANRKLKKLTKLGVNKSKYGKRAMAYGAGAAALGGAALAGTSGVGSAIAGIAARRATNMQKFGSALQRFSRTNSIVKNTTQGNAIYDYGKKIVDDSIKANSQLWNAGHNLKEWSKGAVKNKIVGYEHVNASSTNNHLLKRPRNTEKNKTNFIPKYVPDESNVLGKVSRDQLIRGVAALGAAGLGAAAARNAYRAKTADRNMIRAAEWKREMDRTFAGTKYGKKRRRSNA